MLAVRISPQRPKVFAGSSSRAHAFVMASSGRAAHATQALQAPHCLGQVVEFLRSPSEFVPNGSPLRYELGVVDLAVLMLNFFDLYVASTVIHQNACSSLQTGHLGSLKPPRRLSSQHAVCSAQSCSGEDCSRKITTMSPPKPELLTLTPLLRRQGAK